MLVNPKALQGVCIFFRFVSINIISNFLASLRCPFPLFCHPLTKNQLRATDGERDGEQEKHTQRKDFYFACGLVESCSTLAQPHLQHVQAKISPTASSASKRPPSSIQTFFAYLWIFCAVVPASFCCILALSLSLYFYVLTRRRYRAPPLHVQLAEVERSQKKANPWGFLAISDRLRFALRHAFSTAFLPSTPVVQIALSSTPVNAQRLQLKAWQRGGGRETGNGMRSGGGELSVLVCWWSCDMRSLAALWTIDMFTLNRPRARTPCPIPLVTVHSTPGPPSLHSHQVSPRHVCFRFRFVFMCECAECMCIGFVCLYTLPESIFIFGRSFATHLRRHLSILNQHQQGNSTSHVSLFVRPPSCCNAN